MLEPNSLGLRITGKAFEAFATSSGNTTTENGLRGVTRKGSLLIVLTTPHAVLAMLTAIDPTLVAYRARCAIGPSSCLTSFTAPFALAWRFKEQLRLA